MADDLFLADKRGIYPIMKRDKRNTPAKGDYAALEKHTKFDATSETVSSVEMPPEINGPKGPEPTRYGDWEQKGRCTDF